MPRSFRLFDAEGLKTLADVLGNALAQRCFLGGQRVLACTDEIPHGGIPAAPCRDVGKVICLCRKNNVHHIHSVLIGRALDLTLFFDGCGMDDLRTEISHCVENIARLFKLGICNRNTVAEGIVMHSNVFVRCLLLVILGHRNNGVREIRIAELLDLVDQRALEQRIAACKYRTADLIAEFPLLDDDRGIVAKLINDLRETVIEALVQDQIRLAFAVFLDRRGIECGT